MTGVPAPNGPAPSNVPTPTLPHSGCVQRTQSCRLIVQLGAAEPSLCRRDKVDVKDHTNLAAQEVEQDADALGVGHAFEQAQT